MHIETHFSDLQLYGFVTGGIAGLASIILFLKGKMRWSVFFLFLAALVMRLDMADIDPFLHLWDEQYHALVAKNMMNHMFIPTLIENPVLPYDNTSWVEGHIWLHKQPLSLWQIALSYKLFGVNEFALRLPLAIMSSLLVLMIFRIGNLWANERIAWCAAFLFTFSNFQMEMVTGILRTDHNDVAFMFYVTASIWSWSEYMTSKNKIWMILIGVFSGMAVMVKWLTGLLVFLGWVLSILFEKQQRINWRSYRDIILSFLVSVVVFLPWQIYKSIRFPVESASEYKEYLLHFTEPQGGHDGDMWYHIDQIGLLYGKIALLLIIPAFYLLFKVMRQNSWKIGLLGNIIAIYLFFSLAVTKMPLFCMMISPIFFLALGELLEKGITLLKIPNTKFSAITTFIILFVVGIFYLDIHRIEEVHTDLDPGNWARNTRLHNTSVAKEVGKLIPSKDYVLFNCKSTNNNLVMYYSGNTAYDTFPDENTYKDLKKRGIKMAVLTMYENLPEFLANDKEVFKINMYMVPD